MNSIVNHWIDNQEVTSNSGRTSPVYNPALGKESKRVALANGEEVLNAIESAKRPSPAGPAFL